MDRWQRHDWWGVVLDAPDVGALARFYSALRGWPIWQEDENDAALDLGEGVAYLAIQRNPDYVPPVWPAAPGSQQQGIPFACTPDEPSFHLQFSVTN